MKLANGWTKATVLAQIKRYNNGTVCSVKEGPVDSLSNPCQYKNKEGNRCFIGCFIPDNHPALRQTDGVRYILCEYPDLVEVMPFNDVYNLTKFQKVHDLATSELYSVAAKWLDANVEE